MKSEKITQAMEKALLEEVFPGAVLLVASGGEPLYHRAFGKLSLRSEGEAVSLQTYYDLASLTKPLASAGIALRLADRGEISLDDPISRWVPSWGSGEKGKVTLFHLLSHSSGLPGWKPLYLEVLKWQEKGEGEIGSEEARRYLYERVHDEPLTRPAGASSEYSDLGFILLGEILERVGGRRLDRLADELIFSPLGVRSVFFLPRAVLPPDASIAPTEECPWRKRVLAGEVHDDHAFVMGGVAGHAGLFGTAEGVFRVASAWLRADRGGKEIFSTRSVSRFWERSGIPGSSFALGWDRPSEPPPTALPGRSYSAAGTKISRRSVGHLGFTGTSLWIDRDRGLIIILLSNRVHPARRNEKIRRFRPKIHDLIVEESEA
jgi:CubicO group peptidase (beta-lactamase class C family)